MNATIDSPWIFRRARRDDPKLRLICIPNAGRGASMFSPWSADLPTSVEVCAVQLPGREARLREPCETSLPALLPKLVEAVAPITAGAYAVYGHSVGALLAFELVRELRRRGVRLPAALVVSGRRAPHRPPLSPISHLRDPELLGALTQRYGAMPAAVLADPEFLAMSLGVIRADLQLMEAHRHVDEPPLPLPLAAYGGRRDATTDEASISDWAAQTSATFKHRMFDGDHFFPDAVRADVTRALREDLAPAL